MSEGWRHQASPLLFCFYCGSRALLLPSGSMLPLLHSSLKHSIDSGLFKLQPLYRAVTSPAGSTSINPGTLVVFRNVTAPQKHLFNPFFFLSLYTELSQTLCTVMFLGCTRSIFRHNHPSLIVVYSETFSFVLTGEDGSRWFCYCRKILVSFLTTLTTQLLAFALKRVFMCACVRVC